MSVYYEGSSATVAAQSNAESTLKKQPLALTLNSRLGALDLAVDAPALASSRLCLGFGLVERRLCKMCVSCVQRDVLATSLSAASAGVQLQFMGLGNDRCRRKLSTFKHLKGIPPLPQPLTRRLCRLARRLERALGRLELLLGALDARGLVAAEVGNLLLKGLGGKEQGFV